VFAVNLHFQSIGGARTCVEKIVRAGRGGDHDLHGKVAIARHGWRQKLARAHIAILCDYAPERVEAFKFGIDVDLLRVCRTEEKQEDGCWGKSQYADSQ
jgi:hypothetical protein